jgi:hypothetical protein
LTWRDCPTLHFAETLATFTVFESIENGDDLFAILKCN